MNIEFSILISIATVIAVGLFLSKRNLKEHIPLLVSLFFLLIYLFITPVHFYYQERFTILPNDDTYYGVGRSFQEVMEVSILYFSIANLLFVCGYLLFSYKSENRTRPIYSATGEMKRKLIVLFAILFAIVLFDTINAGINPVDILLGQSEKTLYGATTTSNYLKNFADSLITLLLLAWFYKVKKSFFYPMLFASIILFVLMGFRYRLLLLAIGFFFLANRTLQLSLSKIVKLSLASLAIFYLIFFFSFNRRTFYAGNFSAVIYNPGDFDYSQFFEQTRGALADFTIIQYFSDVENEAEYDHGETALFTVVRALPRSVIGEDYKDELYKKVPLFAIQDKAYNLPYSSSIGEATTHYGYFFVAFGWYGIFGLSFLMGIFLRWISNYFRRRDNLTSGLIPNILIACSCFMFITRGYLPQVIEGFVYLMIPIWILLLWVSKRKSIAVLQ